MCYKLQLDSEIHKLCEENHDPDIESAFFLLAYRALAIYYYIESGFSLSRGTWQQVAQHERVQAHE